MDDVPPAAGIQESVLVALREHPGYEDFMDRAERGCLALHEAIDTIPFPDGPGAVVARNVLHAELDTLRRSKEPDCFCVECRLRFASRGIALNS